MPFLAQSVAALLLIVLIDCVVYDAPIPLVQNWKEECLLNCLMKNDTNCDDFRNIDSPAVFSKCLNEAFQETRSAELSIPCFYDSQCHILRSPADYPTSRQPEKQKLIQVQHINSTTAKITAAENELTTGSSWTMIISTKAIFDDNFWEILGFISSEIPTETLIMSQFANLCEPVHARAMLVAENIEGNAVIYESEPVEMSRLLRKDDFRLQRISMEYLPGIDQIEAVYSLTNHVDNVDHEWPFPDPNVDVTANFLLCSNKSGNETKLFSLQQISRIIDGWNFTVYLNPNYTVICQLSSVFVQVNLTLPCFGNVLYSLAETFKCDEENQHDCLTKFIGATPKTSRISNASPNSDAEEQQPGAYPGRTTSHISKLWQPSDIAMADTSSAASKPTIAVSIYSHTLFIDFRDIPTSQVQCANTHIVLENAGSSCSNGQRVRSDDDHRCCAILRLMSPINVHNSSEVKEVQFPDSVRTYNCQFYVYITCWFSLIPDQWGLIKHERFFVEFEPAVSLQDIDTYTNFSSLSKHVDTNKLNPTNMQPINLAGSTSIGKRMDSNTKLAISVAVPLSLLLILISAGILLYFYRHDVQRTIRKGSSKKSQTPQIDSDLEMVSSNLQNSAHYDYDRTKLAPANPNPSGNNSANGTFVPSDPPNSRRPARKFLRLEQDLLQPPGKNYYSSDPLTSSPSGHTKNDYSNFSAKNDIMLPATPK